MAGAPAVILNHEATMRLESRGEKKSALGSWCHHSSAMLALNCYLPTAPRCQRNQLLPCWSHCHVGFLLPTAFFLLYLLWFRLFVCPCGILYVPFITLIPLLSRSYFPKHAAPRRQGLCIFFLCCHSTPCDKRLAWQCLIISYRMSKDSLFWGPPAGPNQLTWEESSVPFPLGLRP